MCQLFKTETKVEIARNKHYQLIKEGANNYHICKDGRRVAWGRYKGDMCYTFLKFLEEDGDMVCTVDFNEWGN